MHDRLPICIHARKELPDGREESMGRQSQNRFHPPARGIVHQGRQHNRPYLGLEESFSEGTCLRNAHAQLFHQSRWPRTERHTPEGIRESEGAALAQNQEPQNIREVIGDVHSASKIPAPVSAHILGIGGRLGHPAETGRNSSHLCLRHLPGQAVCRVPSRARRPRIESDPAPASRFPASRNPAATQPLRNRKPRTCFRS